MQKMFILNNSDETKRNAAVEEINAMLAEDWRVASVTPVMAAEKETGGTLCYVVLEKKLRWQITRK